jgi:hypothetical protein
MMIINCKENFKKLKGDTKNKTSPLLAHYCQYLKASMECPSRSRVLFVFPGTDTINKE